MSNQTLTLPDKRQLGYAVEGEGKPVIYFHGTASSRLEILLLKEFAHTNHFQADWHRSTWIRLIDF